MAKISEDLAREIKQENVVYGSKLALKQGKQGNVEKVYVTTDCPASIEQELKKIKVNVIRMNATKEEMREACKKPFGISVISILKSKIEKKEKQEKKSKAVAKARKK